MTRRTIPRSFVFNTLPKSLCERFGPIATLCLCDPAQKARKPGCKCGEEERAPCLVLDPFMGSGTVAVVSRELNRSSVGCELNPEYVKIIQKRLQADSQLDTGTVSYRFEVVE